jgi:hypothetical protein
VEDQSVRPHVQSVELWVLDRRREVDSFKRHWYTRLDCRDRLNGAAKNTATTR